MNILASVVLLISTFLRKSKLKESVRERRHNININYRNNLYLGAVTKKSLISYISTISVSTEQEKLFNMENEKKKM